MPPPVRPDAETRLSVVVVTYNSAAALAATLPPLVAQLGPRDELVVVDNASHDDDARGRPRAGARGASCTEPAATPASRPARTRARPRRPATCCCSSIPTRRPAPGFVEAIAAPLDDGRGWAAWMGLVTAEDGRVVNTNGGVVHFTGIAWAGEAGVPAPGSLTSAREAAFLSGACLAIPRTEWERAGGFAERYFMYHEDVDLSLRLRLAGGRLGVEPSAVVDHDYDVRQGAGEVAAARAQPLGDDRALLSRPAAARGRARAAGHRARAARRRGGRRMAAAEAPRHGRGRCSGCRDCCASAARSRRLARSPRSSSRAGSRPTSTRRTSGAPGGWRRCAGRSARTGGSP